MQEYYQDNNISNSSSNININNKKKKNMNNQMDMEAKLDITNINITRVELGLKPIKAIWCKICRLQNQHFWWNCPNIRCNICNGAHLTKNCEMLRNCQYCGSDKHLSQSCNNLQGMNLKANRYRKMYLMQQVWTHCNELQQQCDHTKTKIQEKKEKMEKEIL